MVTYAYAANGSLATLLDQRGVEHTYVYDSLGRLTDDEVTSLGYTNGEVDDAVLAVVTAYDSAGRPYKVTDNLGRENWTVYDAAGRTIKTIQNYDDGTVEETDTACDITTEYQYDSFGRLVTMTVYNAKGDDSDPNNENIQSQATKYLYESEVNASWQTTVVYPDSTDTLSQNSTTKIWTFTTDNGDHVSTAYDRLGRAVTSTDQRGVVHTYSYDFTGRFSADTATSLGSSGIVDDTIRRIGTTYDDLGRVEFVTSYSDTSGTSIVNQVQYVYDSWGNVYREYQEHDGAVDGNTLFTEYDYSDGATGGVAKYVRLDTIKYPNGREIDYNYASGVDEVMSRLSSISDTSGTLAAYEYLGAGKIVVEDFVEAETRLTYLDSNGDITGLDRFGRVVDQIWERYGDDPSILDEYTYEYDRAGNRTSKDNELHAAFDEDYTYDALDRLATTTRADSFDQSWSLDGLGNFAAFNDDGTSQTRTTNAANEITGISGTWIDPTYDAAGNMISGPKTGDETTRIHYAYDAWNRLTAVHADDTQNPGTPGDLIAAYEYDGANRRVEKTLADATATDYYYNQQWQMLESRTADGETTAFDQYVWSARYIDSPIVRYHDANGDGDLLDVGDTIRHYTTDANYNVTATLDATGAVVSRCVYDAYGKTTVYDDAWANGASPTEDGPLYCGYFFDAETANFLARNRYYTVALATWISEDPMAADVNSYRYCGNNPLTATDPSGKATNPTTPRPAGNTTGFVPQGDFDVEFKNVPINDLQARLALGSDSSPGYVVKYIPAKNACPGGKIVVVQAIDHGAKINEKLPKFDGDVGKNGEWPVYDPKQPGVCWDRPYMAAITSNYWFTTVCAVCIHDKPYSQQVLGCINLRWDDSRTNPSISVITASGRFRNSYTSIKQDAPAARFPATAPGPNWRDAEINYGGEK